MHSHFPKGLFRARKNPENNTETQLENVSSKSEQQNNTNWKERNKWREIYPEIRLEKKIIIKIDEKTMGSNLLL